MNPLAWLVVGLHIATLVMAVDFMFIYRPSRRMTIPALLGLMWPLIIGLVYTRNLAVILNSRGASYRHGVQTGWVLWSGMGALILVIAAMAFMLGVLLREKQRAGNVPTPLDGVA